MMWGAMVLDVIHEGAGLGLLPVKLHHDAIVADDIDCLAFSPFTERLGVLDLERGYGVLGAQCGDELVVSGLVACQ